MSEDKKNVTDEDLEVSKSLFQLMKEQFVEHKAAKYSFFVIIFMLTMALSAPLISNLVNITPNSQNIFNRYSPMMSKNVISDDEQESLIESFIERNPEKVTAIVSLVQSQESGLSELEDASEDDVIFELMDHLKDPVNEKLWIEKNNESINALINVKESFTTFHILGTDELGRDVAMRLLYGARISIGVGLLVSFASAIIGLLIGALSGYFGGFIDTLLMRITDSLISLPQLPLMIVFAAIDLSKIPLFNQFVGTENESIIKLVTILCLFSWMTVARLVRGSVLVLKEQEFILAAKNVGASSWNIIMTHMVPNTLGVLLVAVTINVGSSILSEAALSFLGLGIQPPIPSWGNMLFNAKEVIYESPALTIFPGLLIFIVVISFNFIGDGLQNSVNPKSIQR